MKKFLGLIVAVVLMISSFTLSFDQSVTANAQSLDKADQYFVDFVLSDNTYEGSLQYSHNALYNTQLEQNGREYLFSIGDVDGYALMVEFKHNDDVYYEIEELFYNRPSPFAGCQGLPVFVTHNVYLDYVNEQFVDISSGVVVDSEILSELEYKGFNYFGGTTATFTPSSETINYATKSTSTYSIQYDLPDLGGAVGTSCANVAGAIVITYYDRFATNLIPNYEPTRTIGSIVRYKTGTSEVINLTTELNSLMLIGEPHAGTTFSEFQLGMQTYASQHGGYTYTSTNMFTNDSFDFNKYKSAVENNKPVVVFLTNFSMIYSIVEGDGQDVVNSRDCLVSHAAAACGYRVDTYYNSSNNVISTRRYLKVASGIEGYGIGYLNINVGSTISKAISIDIS